MPHFIRIFNFSKMSSLTTHNSLGKEEKETSSETFITILDLMSFHKTEEKQIIQLIIELNQRLSREMTVRWIRKSRAVVTLARAHSRAARSTI